MYQLIEVCIPLQCFKNFTVIENNIKHRQTLVYLISGLGTGVGIRCRDAMSAAGSLFTSPGSSALLEVITSLGDAGWFFSGGL